MNKKLEGLPHALAMPRAVEIFLGLSLLLFFLPQSSAVLQNSINPLEHFPGDYYKVSGSPYLVPSLEKSTAYQKENTTLFISIKNLGNVSSIRVNEEPVAGSPEEAFASKLELDLELSKTTAQDISVRLVMPYAQSQRPLEIKREVAYSGNLREGQVSPVLAFPVEIYRNTTPGCYTILAVINYSYQKDVAVKPKSDRPQNPDIFYLYQGLSQIEPLLLKVERRSGAELRVFSISPEALAVGSKDNIVRIMVENIGSDIARDVVARLRPESGIYVSVDQSPIPSLSPGEKSELIFKVDVSKEAVAGKRYMFKLLFEFSDSLREDLTDSSNAYLAIKQAGIPPYLWAAAIAAVAGIVVLLARRMQKKKD